MGLSVGLVCESEPLFQWVYQTDRINLLQSLVFH